MDDENIIDGDDDDYYINAVNGGDDCGDDGGSVGDDEEEWSRWVSGLPGDHLLWFGEKIPEPIFTLHRPTPFQF